MSDQFDIGAGLEGIVPGTPGRRGDGRGEPWAKAAPQLMQNLFSARRPAPHWAQKFMNSLPLFFRAANYFTF